MQSIFFRRIIVIVVSVIVISISTFSLFTWYKNSREIILPISVDIVTPKYKVVGTSVEGRKIESYTYGQGKNHLVFVGGIHGGYEWNSVYLAYRFLDYLKENPNSIPTNLTVTVIPSANPDGMFKVVGKEGRFTVADVPTNPASTTIGRFNANKVDINRNFDCKWQPGATWRGNAVSAGTNVFSEPEAIALRNFTIEIKPRAFVFWHSQANAVYASQCENGILPETLAIMNSYAQASGYQAIPYFDSYVVTGAVEDWLAKINIPAITVELKTHENIEWEKNLAGIKALLDYYNSSI